MTWLRKGKIPLNVLRTLEELHFQNYRTENNACKSDEPEEYREKAEFLGRVVLFDREEAYDQQLGLHVVWHKLGLPFAFDFGDSNFTCGRTVIPADLLSQLVGQKIEFGMKVVDSGVECYVVGLESKDHAFHRLIGKCISHEHLSLVDTVYGVDARLIDINA